MDWLFDTTPFVSRLNCGEWDLWMYPLSLCANLCYIFTYTIMPIGLLFFHMFRGNSFAFPKWATSLAIIFMTITCINRLNTIASFRYPAFRFYILCEAVGGITALIVGFSLPHIMKLAVDAPTRHRMLGLQNEVKLYQQLDAIITKHASITRDQVIKELRNQNVDKETLDRVRALLDTLAQK